MQGRALLVLAVVWDALFDISWCFDVEGKDAVLAVDIFIYEFINFKGSM